MFLKTGDKVRVIAGKDKGKDGKIIKAIAADNRVVVEGINKVKKHQKASQANPQGNVSDVEAPINASNVMLIDPSTNEPTRISMEVKDGKKIRISKKSHKAID
ncbi:50S ribosomal protein L24 [Fructilactobacillus lindneri]|uniref:Large ribosomal subunit protein uL24 n=2 Tax=Fructilactobacillus lindneri TaxID=53444 RepID=A0A0R2JN84_9LACO|nr:50S ribosomal protein L24 [Fructilactobacillus lindneri]ANZ57933.1 50S ribosomal protein L24 [Fructilactobacillus lindneri]ANZ59203.1 50S ribosomal protein L24 [Fructilactobacillus lindneri]KRN78594.1 50S ribosomal protein L24 [Fructilactobacillus lindneri DSM 20690 = JCM 11027]POG98253.1 50S ribosomal protein L24 [Fructilactobacillus lindneri]POH01630.1 50S ribosomal protein L24 [Fructilactobacillus lindneri]